MSVVDLVIIGHVGINDERSPHGETRGPGGAGYGGVRGASLLTPERIGLVSAVGTDYDPEPLRRLGVDTRGVGILNGPSAHFRIVQHADGQRSFDADLGVASRTALSCFPREYESAGHVHICTAPPAQQLEWLGFLRALPGRRTVSGDAFEHYAETDPGRSRAALLGCDLCFLNDEERRLLFPGETLPRTPVVTKHGGRGASYSEAGRTWHAATEAVVPVDSTHAGEILAGVFLALRLASVDRVTALRQAVRAATAKVTQFGVDGDRLLRVLSEIRSDVLDPRDRASAARC
ncbi:carbohydrate kinase family protein [Streptosporangium sp. NPDC002524]|uniref:carbohydrate kinase family protein n=1 Tax=Streptosporangium sp. NPDC002524 TaxID=3154537 RepID=UPI003330ADF0